MQSGVFVEKYSSGKLKMTGEFKNGLKEGSWKEYDETGKIATDTRYKKGEAR